MAQCVLQFVVKVNPGADMSKVMAQIKKGSAIWKRHGAEVSAWAVGVGEAGNLSVTCRFNSIEAYGKASDAVVADPAFQAWQMESTAAGQTTWVRSNLARAIPLD